MHLSEEQNFWDISARNTPAYVFYNLAEYNHISTLLKFDSLNGKNILEIGCGKGVWTANLARTGANVFHFDLSSYIVATAKEAALPHTTFGCVTDMHFLPFVDDAFDFVFGSMVLHHSHNHELLGHEVARVLKPSGRAVFHENSNRNPLLRLSRKLLVGHLGIPKYSSPDEHPLRQVEIRDFGNAFTSYRCEFLRMMLFQLAVKYLLRREEGPIYQFAGWMDRLFYEYLPRWRYWSYYQILHFDKGND